MIRHFLTRRFFSAPAQVATQTAPATPPSASILQQPTFTRTPTVQCFITAFPKRQPIGIAQLQKSVFAAPIRPDIMHRAVVYSWGQQRGVIKRNAKSRAETRGTGKKMRPQKGCGAARVRDRRSPLFVGGARAFPVRMKDYRINMNRKELDFAVRSALSSKYAQNQLVVTKSVSDLFGDSSKNSLEEHINVIETHMAQNGWLSKRAKTLFVLDKETEAKELQILDSILDHAINEKFAMFKDTDKLISKRKIRKEHQRIRRRARVKVVPAGTLDCYDVLAHDNVVITRAALQRIELRYHVV